MILQYPSLENECMYKNNVYEIFTINNIKNIEITYNKGNILIKRYHDNGSLYQIERYEQGLLHGKQEKYSKTGLKLYEENFNNGTRHGTCIYQFCKVYFENKNYPCTILYTGIPKAFHYNFNNGVLDGRQIIYLLKNKENNYQINNIFREYNCQNGKPHGKCMQYYSNGQIKKIRNYNAGKRDGEQIGYYENGVLKYKANYKNGKYHGTREIFYLNENKYKFENYLNGKLHGKQECFRHNQVVYEINYHHGLLHGIEEKFFPINEKYQIEWIFGYSKKSVMKIYYTLKKAKWIRLANFTKTKTFNEWWYSPDNPGGKLAKKKLLNI
jgi:antitoxin component YwqK of YwqJK toxin-antitoxin module